MYIYTHYVREQHTQRLYVQEGLTSLRFTCSGVEAIDVGIETTYTSLVVARARTPQCYKVSPGPGAKTHRSSTTMSNNNIQQPTYSA